MLIGAAAAVLAAALLLLGPLMRRWLHFAGYWTTANPSSSSTAVAAVRFGVLGCARITPRALIRPCETSNHSAIHSLASSSSSSSSLRAFCQTHHLPVNIATTTPHYSDAIHHAQVNAVYIPLPNGLHYAYAKLALLAGRHCLVEKPLCANAREAKELCQLAKRNGLVLMEASHCFYHPAVREMREMVQARWGRTTGGKQQLLIEAEFHSRIPHDDIRYNCGGKDPSLCGGALLDNGVYVINAVRFLVAALMSNNSVVVESAQADTRCFDGGDEVDEAVRATLRFVDDDGDEGTRKTITANIACSFTKRRMPYVRVSEDVEGGSITLYNFLLPNLWHCIVDRGGASSLALRQAYGETGNKTTYEYQLDEFVRRVRDSTPVAAHNDPIDPVSTLDIIDTIYAKCGLPPNKHSRRLEHD